MRSPFLTAAILLSSASTAEAATVAAASAQPTAIAQLVAGQSYTLAISGTADLNFTYNNGKGLPFYADGKSTYVFPGVLAAFANGSTVDPSSGRHAQATDFAFGALVGSFVAAPGQIDYFSLRNGMTLQSATNITLFGLVNDSAYSDNAGGYQVTLTANPAVPEPATWAMMMLGFGGLGYALRRRQRVNAGARIA